MLTKEFKRGYSEGAPAPKKKEAPPVVVMPDNVQPTVNMKETRKEPPKATDNSGGESCPICLELLSNDGMFREFLPCCGNTVCVECFEKCTHTDPRCALCREPFPTTEAGFIAQLRRRVDKGDPTAQFNLGVAYERGKYGLKKITKRAVRLYELSAAQGYAPAQFNLGNCFSNGTDGTNKKKALKYLKMAADQGHAKAQYRSGIMYYKGEGAGRDLLEAQKYWELAAAQGHQGAQENLAILESQNARR